MDSDLKELKRIVRKAAGAVAMDSAISDVSLTFTEQQNLRNKPQPTGMDSNAASIEPDANSGYAESLNRVRNHWNSVPQITGRRDRRLQSGPVDGLTYRHPGQPSFDGKEEEQSSMAELKPNSEPHATDDSLSADDVEFIAMSLRADRSDTFSGDKRELGLERANREYASRRGVTPVSVS
jgi:hypothetical protein